MVQKSRYLLFACVWALCAAFAAQPISATEPTAKATIKVLLVNGKSGKDPKDQSAWYLSKALDPFEDKRDSNADDGIRPKMVSVEEFGKLGAKDLENWKCIFLCDVPRLKKDDVRALEGFVRAGGGVVFCLGPQVDAEAYNTELFRDGKGLLPAKLLGQRKAKEKRCFHFAFDKDAFELPPLKNISETSREFLRYATFSAFVRLGEINPKAKARTILSFEETSTENEKDGSSAGIAILEWQPFAIEKIKGGHVVVIATTINTEWNNWPLSILFVPLTHSLVRSITPDRQK